MSETTHDLPRIGNMGWNEFIDHVQHFHGYAAPGVLLGGIMVEIAKKHLNQLMHGEQVLFDALAEATNCLPDAVQLLTPCTYGNGWLKVADLNRYALTLYNKHSGEGVRVFVDGSKIDPYPTFYEWFMNRVDKKDQDENKLREEIRVGAEHFCSVEAVTVPEAFRTKIRKGRVELCPVCNEPYPVRDGGICRGCQGYSPIHSYSPQPAASTRLQAPELKKVAVEDAVGGTLLHDMTQIIPGESKGPVFKAGQKISAGDLCRLHEMGRRNVFLRENLPDNQEWVHENDVAMSFAKAMCGEGTSHEAEAKEGKVKISAARDGLLIVNEERLETFNLVPGVMCATRHSYSVVKANEAIAGTRAIPLYLPRSAFITASAVLEQGSIFSVLPMRKAKVGILVTGTEVFRGLVQDKFAAIITKKIKAYNCDTVHNEIVPDELDAVKAGVNNCLNAGADLIITTAGLSVDPDDITRKALIESGLTHDTFGFPVLPGAMTLVGRIKNAQILGVPACALFHKTTAMDLMLPRLLAGLGVTRRDAAKLGHGGLCLECKSCTYPICPFGK